ncbi:superoxide dismutase [Podospora didyma]|uniref:superoxide dismutase n=1 Tax=Podospora didyma TaxID=330526 RepID=A0AAE0U838_9PEZI|nr:superoxide dismutase [Podospora didyma]
MHLSTSLSLLFAVAGTRVVAQTPSSSSAAAGPTTGQLGDAAPVTNNPPGVVLRAVFPEKAFTTSLFPDGGNIKGEVIAISSPDGDGVLFQVKLSNLPKTGGPFSYHLHVDPVPADGNCTKTLAHLDPYIRGETPVCDKSAPATCQVGDLSGKYGAIPETSDTFSAVYLDKYASTLEGIGAYFGNRSIVIHQASTKARITCASFEVIDTTGTGGVPGEASTCSSAPAASSAVSVPSPSGNVTIPRPSTTPPTPSTSTSASTSPIVTAGSSSLRGMGVGCAGAAAFAAAFMLTL